MSTEPARKRKEVRDKVLDAFMALLPGPGTDGKTGVDMLFACLEGITDAFIISTVSILKAFSGNGISPEEIREGIDRAAENMRKRIHEELDKLEGKTEEEVDDE